MNSLGQLGDVMLDKGVINIEVEKMPLHGFAAEAANADRLAERHTAAAGDNGSSAFRLIRIMGNNVFGGEILRPLGKMGTGWRSMHPVS